MQELVEHKAAALAAEAERSMARGDVQAAGTLAARALSLHAGQPLALAVRERIATLAAPGYSVVIPTCNRLDILQRCLHCLERQTLPRDRFEVIVVDDASTDGTADFLASHHPPFTLRTIVMPRRGGPGKARNAGIRAARGDIVHFLNDDALIEPHVLALHATLHEALADTPVSVLGRFDFAPPFTDTLWGYTLQHGDLLFRYPTFTHNGLHGHTSYYTCNISTPRQQLVQAGLFDEAFTGGQWGAEDMEFGMRLAALPVPVLFRDDSRSVHVHDVGVEGLARTALVRGGGAVWLFAKHGGSPHYARIGARDVAYWRNLPTRVTERMRELHAVLARTEDLRPTPDPVTVPAPEGTTAPYLRREDHDDMHRLCLGLWPLRTRELLQVIDGVERMALDVLHAAERGATMQECAARLYPAQLFIRFFHDTIGVCGVDTIRRFCPDAPALPTLDDTRDAAPDAAPGETTNGTPNGTTDDMAQPCAAPPRAGRRVLLACNFFWPSVGGTELFIETLGLHLRAMGHHVEIACRWQENRASELRHGMPIHAFRCHGKFTDPTMGPDTERYRALVRNGGYDAVIVLAHPDNWACHLLANLPQPHPRIIMLPSINAENMEHWAERGVLDDIARTLRAADVCVAVSENGHDSRLFTELGVPQAFVPHAMDPSPAPWDMRARLGLPHGVPLLACVGNFWPVKNQLALLRRLADAPPAAPPDGTPGDAPDWRLVLAGGALPWEKERRYFEECWQLARHNPRVRMLGPLPPEEATALIRDADLLLVPSQGESAGPLVVLEAMALGTPWVATPQCNAVHDEGGGVIAPLEDFPRVIGQLLARPDVADGLARNGRAHWERCFRWATVAPLFDALVRNGSTPAGARMPDDLRTARQRLADAVLGV